MTPLNSNQTVAINDGCHVLVEWWSIFVNNICNSVAVRVMLATSCTATNCYHGAVVLFVDKIFLFTIQSFA